MDRWKSQLRLALLIIPLLAGCGGGGGSSGKVVAPEIPGVLTDMPAGQGGPGNAMPGADTSGGVGTDPVGPGGATGPGGAGGPGNP